MGLKFVEAIAGTFENVADPELAGYAAEIMDAIMLRLKENNEKDMKEIDLLSVKGLMNAVGPILESCKKATGKNLRQEIEKMLVEGQLKSDNLMRKLQGLALVRENYSLPIICTGFLIEWRAKRKQKKIFSEGITIHAEGTEK